MDRIKMPGHLIRRLHQQSTQVFQAQMQAAGFDLTSVQFAALDALDRGDVARHDQLAADAAWRLADQGCKVIALAQFSLARARDAVVAATGLPVFTTVAKPASAAQSIMPSAPRLTMPAFSLISRPRPAMGGGRGRCSAGEVGARASSLAAPRALGAAASATAPLASPTARGRDGSVDGASVAGPMAEVVFNGTQLLRHEELRAMANYLRALPVRDPSPPAFLPADGSVLAAGERLYGLHCADCHGKQGEGQAGAYPPLAGNRVVTMDDPTNALQAIVGGGFTGLSAALALAKRGASVLVLEAAVVD